MRRLPGWADFVIVVALVVWGCGTVASTASPSVPRQLPTWCTSGPCVGTPADVPRSGILRAQDGCIWLEIDSVRAAVLWPRGFTALDAPLRVFDANGALVGQADHSMAAIIVGPEPIPATSCGETRQVRVYF